MQPGSRIGTHYPFSFTGTGSEYFRIWIVNIFLTIVTLYVYSAWAKVRTKRYFYGNTVLDGTSFEYHAKPTQILLSRIIAVLLLLAVTVGGALSPIVSGGATLILLVILPWALWRSIKFNARMTSYRNVRFGFDGRLGPIVMYQLILPFLPLIILVSVALLGNTIVAVMPDVTESLIAAGVLLTILIVPWIHKLSSNYYLRHYQYGRTRFAGELSLLRFYWIYIAGIFLGLTIAILLAALAGAVAFSMGVLTLDLLRDLNVEALDDATLEQLIWSAGIAFYVLFFIVGIFVNAYFRARVRQHLYDSAVLDSRIALESTVRARSLWWIMLTNVLMMIFTFGLAIPFAKVRVARYIADNSAAYADESLDHFVSEKREEVGAFGDELGDAFDMDMDVGF